MATEIGRLVALFDADTKAFDQKLAASEKRIQSLKANIASIRTDNIGGKSGRISGLEGLLRKAQADHKGLQQAQKATAQSAKAMGQDMQGALAAVSPRLAGLASAAGPLTAVAAGLVAIGAAAAGIYKLASSSQQLGAEIFDLSQKLNFSAETLSSLKVAAELSGGSLASLSTALGIFDRNMEEARQGGEEMSRIFKVLKIDTTDNEKALRQAFDALGKMSGGATQTALSMKLFGRSGKEVLGILKEMDGDVDGFIKRMEQLGFVIGTEASRAADKFGDELTLLQNQFDAIMRQIGQELVPVVSKAVSDISGWLRANQGEIRKTAEEIGRLISQIYNLAQQIRSISPITLQINIVRRLIEGGTTAGYSDPVARAAMGQGAPLSAEAAKAMPRLSVFRQRGTSPFHLPGFAPPSKEDRAAAAASAAQQRLMDSLIKPPGGAGGGGGKGKGGSQKDVLEGLKSTLAGLHSEFRKLDAELLNSASATSLAVEKERLLNDVMSSLNATTKERIAAMKNVDEAIDAAIGSLPAKSRDAARALIEQSLALHKKNETERIAIILGKQTDDLTRQWARDIENARSGTDQYAIAIQNLEEAYRDHEQVLSDVDRQELQHQATKMRWIAISKGVADALRDASDALAETWSKNRWKDFELPSMNDAATDLRQKWLDDYKDKIDNLASDITSVLDNAIYDGFRGGGDRGLASLGLGFLDMINQVILGQLKNAIAEALTAGSASGGGWFGKLLGFFVGAAVGGVGGGGGKIGGTNLGGSINLPGFRASGGPVSMNSPYIVGERGPELFVPNSSGKIVPNAGNTTYNIHATFEQKGMQTHRQKRSQREVAERLRGLLAT